MRIYAGTGNLVRYREVSVKRGFAVILTLGDRNDYNLVRAIFLRVPHSRTPRSRAIVYYDRGSGGGGGRGGCGTLLKRDPRRRSNGSVRVSYVLSRRRRRRRHKGIVSIPGRRATRTHRARTRVMTSCHTPSLLLLLLLLSSRNRFRARRNNDNDSISNKVIDTRCAPALCFLLIPAESPVVVVVVVLRPDETPRDLIARRRRRRDIMTIIIIITIIILSYRSAPKTCIVVDSCDWGGGARGALAHPKNSNIDP